MRSTVSEDAPVSPYPCLKISHATSTVVLFTSAREGTVVTQKTACWGLGHHSTTWQEDAFLPFSGKVTLSNDA